MLSMRKETFTMRETKSSADSTQSGYHMMQKSAAAFSHAVLWCTHNVLRRKKKIMCFDKASSIQQEVQSIACLERPGAFQPSR